MKKRNLVIVAILIVVGLVAFFVLQSKSLEKMSVSLKWLHQAQFAGMYVAIEEGFYRDAGLDIELKEPNRDTVPFEELKQGRSDFAIMSAEEFLKHIDMGEDFYIVGAIYQKSPYALVSLAENNIKTPADFVGKKLGVKSQKLDEKLLYEFLLDEYGIPLSDVEIKVLGYERTELEDLLSGNVDVIDVYRTDQLYFFDKQSIDYNIIYPERYGTTVFNDVIVTRGDIVRKKPEYVSAFMDATAKGWRVAIEHQESAVKDTLRYVTNEAYNDFDYEAYILEQSAPLIAPSIESKIGAVDIRTLVDLYENLREKGHISKGVDIRDYYFSR